MTAARDMSPYLTLEESAEYLRVDVKTLRRHVMKVIPPLSVGERKFYTREMLDGWHDRKKDGSSVSLADQASRSPSGSRTRKAGLVNSPRVRATLAKLHGKPSGSTSPSSPQDPAELEVASIHPSSSTSS